MKKYKRALLNILWKSELMFLINMLRNMNTLTVVMFHRIQILKSTNKVDTWSINKDNFIKCLHFFCKYYNIISLEDLLVYKKGDIETLPKRSLLITFDDGWIDQFKIGASILKEMEIPAIFFVTSGHLSDFINNQHLMLDAKQLMMREELVSLIERGFHVGVHGLTHKKIDRVDYIREELVYAKENLGKVVGPQHLGLKAFSFPHSIYNDDVIKKALDKKTYDFLFGGGCCLNKFSTLKNKYPVNRVPIIEKLFVDEEEGHFSISKFAWWMITLPHC